MEVIIGRAPEKEILGEILGSKEAELDFIGNDPSNESSKISARQKYSELELSRSKSLVISRYLQIFCCSLTGALYKSCSKNIIGCYFGKVSSSLGNRVSVSLGSTLLVSG